MLGRPSPAEPAEEHAGHHRRTDLVFRIPPGSRPNRGEHYALRVDLNRVLFFDADGRRVTPVQR
jgi:multiple sugar transport system ATP-binding protein